MELKQLIEQCHATAREKGFWDQDRNFGELLMLIVSELGEALEAHRAGKMADISFFTKKHQNVTKKSFEKYIKGTVEEEIADTFIRLFDLCGGMGMDIEFFLNAKMEYNKTRAKLHGKKY